MGDDAVALFDAKGTAARPDLPALNGGRCNACGSIFFPLQSYGCERCGSQDLAPQGIAGRGRLVSSAAVHMSVNPHHPAPYVIGAIATEEGAVVRAVLDVPPGAALPRETVMVARLVGPAPPDRGASDIRFAPLGGVA